MTFLTPLFLLAGLAATIPVVLHMVNRQKAKQLPFSTLRFLQISVQKTRRRKRVHDVFLMAVRAAVRVASLLVQPSITAPLMLDIVGHLSRICRFQPIQHAMEQLTGQLPNPLGRL